MVFTKNQKTFKILKLVRAIEAWINEDNSRGFRKEVFPITRNQLTYWQNQETARSNLAKEAETHRANLANEAEIKRANLAREAEMQRSNLANESEIRRHNLATETYYSQVLGETQRHNLSTELQASKELAATITRNEQQNYTNLINAQSAMRQADAAAMNAQTNAINARTNREAVSVNWFQARVRAAEVAEATRHNSISEGLQLQSLTNIREYNEANLAELNRHNIEVENVNRLNAVTGVGRNYQSAYATESRSADVDRQIAETKRHNEIMEPSEIQLNLSQAREKDAAVLKQSAETIGKGMQSLTLLQGGVQ